MAASDLAKLRRIQATRLQRIADRRLRPGAEQGGRGPRRRCSARDLGGGEFLGSFHNSCQELCPQNPSDDLSEILCAPAAHFARDMQQMSANELAILKRIVTMQIQKAEDERRQQNMAPLASFWEKKKVQQQVDAAQGDNHCVQRNPQVCAPPPPPGLGALVKQYQKPRGFPKGPSATAPTDLPMRVSLQPSRLDRQAERLSALAGRWSEFADVAKVPVPEATSPPRNGARRWQPHFGAEPLEPLFSVSEESEEDYERDSSSHTLPSTNSSMDFDALAHSLRQWADLGMRAMGDTQEFPEHKIADQNSEDCHFYLPSDFSATCGVGNGKTFCL